MKKKPMYAILLIIFSLAFAVFVIFMQQRFNNPEFEDIPVEDGITEEEAQQEPDQEDNDDEESNDDTDSIAGAAGSVVNEETDEDEEEESESTSSTRIVTVETLNARSGPGIDYEITGVLSLDQVVEVEDVEDGWAFVSTDEFEGYVNEDYLAEE